MLQLFENVWKYGKKTGAAFFIVEPDRAIAGSLVRSGNRTIIRGFAGAGEGGNGRSKRAECRNEAKMRKNGCGAKKDEKAE